MSEQIIFIASKTVRSIKEWLPHAVQYGLMAPVGLYMGYITQPRTPVAPNFVSVIFYGAGVLGCGILITSVLSNVIVNAKQRDSYRRLSALLEKSLISSWTGDASAFSKIRSSFPPIGAFPDHECIFVATEQYYDIPETNDAVVFKNELLDEFYKRIFRSQIDDIRVINLGNEGALHFGHRNGIGYDFYWIDLQNRGNKISWALKYALLDELGWSLGHPTVPYKHPFAVISNRLS